MLFPDDGQQTKNVKSNSSKVDARGRRGWHARGLLPKHFSESPVLYSIELRLILALANE